MKKLIALLLAVSSLVMSTSVFAYTTIKLYPIKEGTNVEGVTYEGESRNFVNNHKDSNFGSPVFRKLNEYDDYKYLPTYRPGDTITFDILCDSGNAKVNDGDVLTFICSEYSATGYENGNVQMIDQTTLSPLRTTAHVYCTYKLRDDIADGRYKLEMRLYDTVNKTEASDTFVFLIGRPEVELLYVNKIVDDAEPTKADKYWFENGNAYCFAKATITGGANFSQTGTEFGFIFDKNDDGKIDKTVDGPDYDGTYTKKTERDGDNLTPNAQAVAEASAGHNSETYGDSVYFFRMTIEDVYTDDGTVLTDEKKTEFCNKLPDVDVFLND